MGVYPNQATNMIIDIATISLQSFRKTKPTVKKSQWHLSLLVIFHSDSTSFSMPPTGNWSCISSRWHLEHMSLRYHTVLDSDFGRRNDINLPRLGSFSHLPSPLLLPAYRASSIQSIISLNTLLDGRRGEIKPHRRDNHPPEDYYDRDYRA